MNNKRIIIVSNRLPVQLTERKGQLIVSPSSGGLVSSLKSYIERKKADAPEKDNSRMVWVGSADISDKKIKEYSETGIIFENNFELHPVFIPAVTKDKYYNGFSNDTIWPLFHYFPSYAKFKVDFYEHYVIANKLFCEKVISVYKPGDIIWVHDYHLMLLPEMLRADLPNASIGFFLHIPFPSFELFRLFPNVWRRKILSGILGADLVGFHTNDYLQHFMRSVRQILGYENNLHQIITPERSVTIDTFPISIDYNKFNAAVNDPGIFAERNRIKKGLAEIQIIVSVDRLDYTKGVVNRLEGYALFLEKNPSYIGKVKFILITVPSRDIITKYKEIKKQVEGLVSRINGKYGNIEWTPVVYQYKSIDFKKLTALYMAADIALVTPLRDGMNLVAKEFIATRNNKRGVLILSETAGAALELCEAIIINPTDRNEIANAILQALTMPIEEQIQRNEVMQKRLRNYDVVRWAEDFISQLSLCKAKQETLKIKEITPGMEEKIVNHYNHATKRLLLLDYDGTLTPIAKFPHLAFPNESLLNLLRAIAEDTKNTVVIISGRPYDVLEKWLGNLPVHLIAEHGALIKSYDRKWKPTTPFTTDWKASVIPILNMFAERCVGTFVEEKNFSVAWHYRNADKEHAFVRSRELINELLDLASHLDFQVIEGNKVIEARTRGVDKGTAANIYLQSHTYDFLLTIGDDRTDEDLFRAMPPEAISIKVGLVQSMARYNLKYQQNVIHLLSKFLPVNLP